MSRRKFNSFEDFLISVIVIIDIEWLIKRFPTKQPDKFNKQ